jgi:hypothetical protein
MVNGEFAKWIEPNGGEVWDVLSGTEPISKEEAVKNELSWEQPVEDTHDYQQKEYVITEEEFQKMVKLETEKANN